MQALQQGHPKMRRALWILTLAFNTVLPCLAGAQPREFPGGARLVPGTDRKGQPVCSVVTPMHGAQAIVQGSGLWFRTDSQLGAVIARSSEPTVRSDQGEPVTVVLVEARVMAVPRDEADALIVALYAGRSLVLTWTDVEKERHTVRIDPGGFAAARDAAVKACGWPPLGVSGQKQ
jgi:hypothetical protein